MSDYVRQMPEAAADLARRPGLAERFHVDLPLLALLLLLTAYGLVVLYSASGQNVAAIVRQGQYFLLAYVLMFIAAQLSLENYQRWAPRFYLVGIGFLLAVIFVGSGAKGAQRWLSLGGFRFQPSEIMKLLVPLTLAWYLSLRILPPRFIYVLASRALLALPAALVAQQPDLGTA